MAKTIDPFSTAIELLAALRGGQVSSVELVALYHDRFESHNPTLNAIVDHDYDGARRDAIEADRLRARGDERPLLGLPITIKDTIDVRGFRATAGVLEWAQRRPEHDAVAVSRLRAAGAIVMGKTNVPPLAADWQSDNPVYGRTNNPWDLDRTPGGSSGGAAAALASGMTALEIGSDIGGSVRVPAAFCGVFGHKSSETALPRSGEVPGTAHPNLGNVLWVHGPLARGPEDLELAFDIASGPDVDEEAGWKLNIRPSRHDRLQDFRVAILPPLSYAPVDREIMAAQERIADVLARRGARVAVAAPDALGDCDGYMNLYAKVLSTQMEEGGVDPAARSRAERLIATGDPLEMGIGAGITATAGDLYRWLGEREVVRASWRRFFHDWDIALAPVTIVPAFPHTQAPLGERSVVVNGVEVPYLRLVVYPGVATLPGQPATAFPAGLTTAGLPIGLQAIGPYLEDRTSLRFVQRLAGEIGGFQRPPAFA